MKGFGSYSSGYSKPSSNASIEMRPSPNTKTSTVISSKIKSDLNEPPKVVFISKAERLRNKLEEQKQADEAARKREQEIKRRREEYLRQQRNNNYKRCNIDERRREEDNRKRIESLKQKIKQDEDKSLVKIPAQSDLANLELLNIQSTDSHSNLAENELEQIKAHYLGLREKKKKIIKPSEKFKTVFTFDWDASEDTAKSDNNPIYQNRHEPQLLFGRGFRAGMDITEQRKRNNFYNELVKRRTHTDAASTYGSDSDVDDDKEDEILHWSKKNLEDMTDRDWRICREDFDIYVKGGKVPPPIRSWHESSLPVELLKAIEKAGYKQPTPIQMQAIPIALEMRDLIGIAVTGSGKTAAFVLPMLTYVKGLPLLDMNTSQDGPYALVMAPSRELALQITDETTKFSEYSGCRTVAVVGGRDAEEQAFKIRNGAEVIIGTPGRIKDMLDRAYTVLNQCNYVILDEADRMIDMGFEEDVNRILDCIPTTNLKDENEAKALEQALSTKAGHRRFRITQMFSATMPQAVEKLTKKYLRAPAYITIGAVGGGKKSITQRLEFVTEGRKRQRCIEILSTLTPPIMIFVNLKKGADALARHLNSARYSAVSLHGGKMQKDREESLDSFKKGYYDILVATDVAGRGLDVEGIQAVINYDMPKDIQAYTHRIGRTGRAGKRGKAISLVTEEDSGIFYDLKQLLISTGNEVPRELAKHPAATTKTALIKT
ncbi:bifunctional P-loop containing nucleoside triphosphate hydrolase/Helicase [Babesia duncani]|uniref:RNA helicase n=1 Tax=Babesia duncani TaxID=323732 RepID=A0AAD9UQK3_9APIC|nr:bifunctional P-loop containing nucleoside triphosphate hydrolase/Helicase [Babesia duncani]